jgi:hypothetical protein
MKKLFLVVALGLVASTAQAQGLDGVFSNLPDNVFDGATDLSSMSDDDFAKALQDEIQAASPSDLAWIDDLNTGPKS